MKSVIAKVKVDNRSRGIQTERRITICLRSFYPGHKIKSLYCTEVLQVNVFLFLLCVCVFAESKIILFPCVSICIVSLCLSMHD